MYLNLYIFLFLTNFFKFDIFLIRMVHSQCTKCTNNFDFLNDKDCKIEKIIEDIRTADPKIIKIKLSQEKLNRLKKECALKLTRDYAFTKERKEFRNINLRELLERLIEEHQIKEVYLNLENENGKRFIEEVVIVVLTLRPKNNEINYDKILGEIIEGLLKEKGNVYVYSTRKGININLY